MKIILIKNVDHVGRAGEVKNVADGFAQNFLIPKKLAVVASERNVALYSKLQIEAQKKLEEIKIGNKNFLNRLKSMTLTIKSKADDKDTFFAGITKDKIAQALINQGFNIKTKNIRLGEAIKKPGEYKIAINVNGEQVLITLRAQKE